MAPNLHLRQVWFQRFQQCHPAARNRLWRADLVAQSLSKDFDELYSYDGLHRLKDMQRGHLVFSGSQPSSLDSRQFAQCWSLDPTSNWHCFKEAATGGSWTLDQSRTANTVNEITAITNWTGPTWTTPTYDAAGNTITIPQPADPTESYTGTYDAWNRQVKLTDDSTDDTVQESQYDARTFRTVRKDYSDDVLAETRHFYFTSGWQGIEERLGSNPNSADAERQFVWGQRYIDDLVLRDRDADDEGTLDERLYGLQDANWNMAALIGTSATAQERYLYSSFGWPIVLDGTMATIRTSSDFDFECLFTGQRLDWTASLHLFRNRWFESISGRFISRDPLDYPNGTNTYAGWFVPNATDASGDRVTCYGLGVSWVFVGGAGVSIERCSDGCGNTATIVNITARIGLAVSGGGVFTAYSYPCLSDFLNDSSIDFDWSGRYGLVGGGINVGGAGIGGHVGVGPGFGGSVGGGGSTVLNSNLTSRCPCRTCPTTGPLGTPYNLTDYASDLYWWMQDHLPDISIGNGSNPQTGGMPGGEPGRGGGLYNNQGP